MGVNITKDGIKMLKETEAETEGPVEPEEPKVEKVPTPTKQVEKAPKAKPEKKVEEVPKPKSEKKIEPKP